MTSRRELEDGSGSWGILGGYCIQEYPGNSLLPMKAPDKPKGKGGN